MKEKVFASMILIIMGGAMMVSFNAFAAEASEVPSVSVYGTKAEQDAVMEAIQKTEQSMYTINKYSITLIKESIMPVYKADLLEYAETGVFTIRPDLGGKDNNVQSYMAKTVTADGVFAGHMVIDVQDGFAYLQFRPTSAVKGFERNREGLSYSYADHARRVQKAVGRDAFVPVGEVRYVAVGDLGFVFYVNDGKTEALVKILASRDVFADQDREIVYIGDEVLKKFADERLAMHKEHLAEVAEWEAANPGKVWGFAGYNTDVSSSGLPRDSVDNIINIAEYLGLKDSDVYYTATTETIATPMPESTKKEDTAEESATVERTATESTTTEDGTETETSTEEGVAEDNTAEESITAESVTAENTNAANAGAASTAAIGTIEAGTENNIPGLLLFALPLAAVALFISIAIIRKGKKAENTDSQNSDH
jgi:hypothetical protein